MKAIFAFLLMSSLSFASFADGNLVNKVSCSSFDGTVKVFVHQDLTDMKYITTVKFGDNKPFDLDVTEKDETTAIRHYSGPDFNMNVVDQKAYTTMDKLVHISKIFLNPIAQEFSLVCDFDLPTTF